MSSDPLLPQSPENDPGLPQTPMVPPASGQVPSSVQPPSRRKRLLRLLAGLLILWAVAAYLLMPFFWKRYVLRHPGLADIPEVTHTGTGIPGDPLNVALVGTQTEIMKIMVAAKWYPADPLTLESCLRIAEASVLKRPYDEAPVSNLFLWGRKEDLAFEQPVGDDPRQRHHVRFWKSAKVDAEGRPVWAGAAIYDRRVGLSHTTGQITHKTGPDIDAERAKLFSDLQETGNLAEIFFIDNFHAQREGRNGGGDPWFTDGRLEVGIIK